MTNLVEFPGIGLEMTVPRVAFTVLGVPVYWYGICIAIGMALALVMAFTQCKRFGIDANRMVDVVLVGLVCAIIGLRAFYVIFFSEGQYETFWDLIDLRSGGLAIYGGIIGAFLGGGLACLWRKVSVLPMFDLASMGFLIGQACGRWGNFFNQEAFGTNTTLPWGMISPTTTAYLQREQAKLALQGVMVDPSMPVHPTFLYESLWCALGFVLLFLYRKRRKYNGEITLMYVMWYGVGRFFIEQLRTDSLMTLGQTFRVSQLLAGLTALLAFMLWLMARTRKWGQPLRVPVPPPTIKKMRVEAGGVVHKVEISWPANTKEPSKEMQREMAMEALAQQSAAGNEGATAEPAVDKLNSERESGDGGEDN